MWLQLLEVKILESEVCFHNSSSFDSGPQHILLCGDISPVGYPLQVIQVALGRESHQSGQTALQASNSGANSLGCRVVELVLPGATEAGLNPFVVPEPLDDPGQLPCHEALFC